MSAEDNPADDNYSLDLAIEEIKQLQAQLANSLTREQVREKLNAVKRYAAMTQSRAGEMLFRDDVYEQLGLTQKPEQPE